MANSQPRHPQARHHPMPLRSEPLPGPFAVEPVNEPASGPKWVHAGFDSTVAFLSAPAPVPVTDAVVVGGRHNSSSSEETEEGFVVVGDEVGAPWDTNHTNNPVPNLASTAVHSVRHSWTSILPSRLRPTASPFPAHSLPQQQRQSSTQDVGAWEMEPPLLPGDDAFVLQDGAVKQRNDNEMRASSSAEATSRLTQAQLADTDELKRPGGLVFVVEDQRGDPLGGSVAWQRRGQSVEGMGEEERAKAAVLAAWKAKDERSERAERDIRSGRLRPRDDLYEMMGGPAKDYTAEKLEVYRREQMLRVSRKEERLAELRRLTEDHRGPAAGYTAEKMELQIREEMWRKGTKEGRLAEMRRLTSEMVLHDGWYERMGGAAAGRTVEEAELLAREQMWRRAPTARRLAEMRRRTSDMVLRDGWYERMGGVASGRTQEEAELRLREQMWRRGRLEETAAVLERRIAGRRSREAAGRG